MGTLLDKLHEYHQLTARLYQLNHQIESQRIRTRVHERKLEELSGEIEELRQQVRRAQASAGEAELDLRSREATLERLRSQLNTARTNKEYSTLLREINSFKADSSRIEDEALRRLAEVDDLKAKLAAVQQQAEEEGRRVEELRRQAADREEELAGQLRQISRQREQASDGLPAELLARLNRVAEAHDGEAMAPIVKLHPKQEVYVCGGCNMSVTLEQVNALRRRDDEIQACNCCGRLLYLDESAKAVSA